jgi:hypothetical protein
MNEDTLLADAKQALLDYGWSQGRLLSKDGSLCALGALYQANWSNFVNIFGKAVFDTNNLRVVHYSRTMQYLIEAIEENYPDRVRDKEFISVVSTFNDHPDTTLEDVFAMYEKADAKVQEIV